MVRVPLHNLVGVGEGRGWVQTEYEACCAVKGGLLIMPDEVAILGNKLVWLAAGAQHTSHANNLPPLAVTSSPSILLPNGIQIGGAQAPLQACRPWVPSLCVYVCVCVTTRVQNCENHGFKE